jgi:hypothetical protein
MCCLSTGLIPETNEAEPEDPSSIFTVPFIIMRLQEMHSVKDMNIF